MEATVNIAPMGTATCYETREDWLKGRKESSSGFNAVTGSLAPMLGGVCPYNTWASAYLDIVSNKQIADNNAMRFGRYFENGVVDYFLDETGYEVTNEGHVLFTHNEKPFIKGSPDRIYVTTEGAIGVLEVKTTAMAVEPTLENDLIRRAWLQAMFYAGLAGASEVSIAYATVNFQRDLGIVTFERDDAVIEYLYSQAEKFWEHVTKGIPPEAETAEDVLRLFPQHRDGEYRSVDQAVVDAWTELNQVKQEEKAITAKKKELEDQLKFAIGEFEGIEYAGKVLATLKAPKPSRRLDTKALKSERPDVFEQFAREQAGSRRLLVKS